MLREESDLSVLNAVINLLAILNYIGLHWQIA